MKQLMVLALLAAGCTDAGEPIATTVDDLSTENGISFNGKSLNGMSFNGMSFNGLDLGLGTTSFASWFNADSARNTIEMQYVVKCAKSSGTTVTWTNPQTGATYSWPGLLGLAPTWTNRAMTTTEQQLITACLLAHGNKYGVHVAIAVEGKTASGSVLPQGTGELTTFSVKEAAFFGNTVTGDGMFVCLDHATWDASRSSARACGYDTHASGASTACPPMYQVGACNSFCTLDASKTYYTSCTYNGKSYVPLTTRLRSQDIYKCGDGVCQFTEHCGNGATYDNCRADCGLCP
jgi:hypothetical protein